MTRKEFLTGTPFKIKGNEQIYKFDEIDGGELLQYVNNKFRYSVCVSVTSSTTFEVYAIRLQDHIYKNKKIAYSDLERVEL